MHSYLIILIYRFINQQHGKQHGIENRTPKIGRLLTSRKNIC